MKEDSFGDGPDDEPISVTSLDLTTPVERIRALKLTDDEMTATICDSPDHYADMDLTRDAQFTKLVTGLAELMKEDAKHNYVDNGAAWWTIVLREALDDKPTPVEPR